MGIWSNLVLSMTGRPCRMPLAVCCASLTCGPVSSRGDTALQSLQAQQIWCHGQQRDILVFISVPIFFSLVSTLPSCLAAGAVPCGAQQPAVAQPAEAHPRHHHHRWWDPLCLTATRVCTMLSLMFPCMPCFTGSMRQAVHAWHVIQLHPLPSRQVKAGLLATRSFVCRRAHW